MNGGLFEEVECFEYSGSKNTVDGAVKFRINDVGKVLGGMKEVVVIE